MVLSAASGAGFGERSVAVLPDNDPGCIVAGAAKSAEIMIVWQEDSSLLESPVYLLLQVDFRPDRKFESKLLGLVGQTQGGQWQGGIVRKRIHPDEDPAIMLQVHPARIEAMKEVQEHLGVMAELEE